MGSLLDQDLLSISRYRVWKLRRHLRDYLRENEESGTSCCDNHVNQVIMSAMFNMVSSDGAYSAFEHDLLGYCRMAAMKLGEELDWFAQKSVDAGVFEEQNVSQLRKIAILRALIQLRSQPLTCSCTTHADVDFGDTTESTPAPPHQDTVNRAPSVSVHQSDVIQPAPPVSQPIPLRPSLERQDSHQNRNLVETSFASSGFGAVGPTISTDSADQDTIKAEPKTPTSIQETRQTPAQIVVQSPTTSSSLAALAEAQQQQLQQQQQHLQLQQQQQHEQQQLAEQVQLQAQQLLQREQLLLQQHEQQQLDQHLLLQQQQLLQQHLLQQQEQQHQIDEQQQQQNQQQQPVMSDATVPVIQARNDNDVSPTMNDSLEVIAVTKKHKKRRKHNQPPVQQPQPPPPPPSTPSSADRSRLTSDDSSRDISIIGTSSIQSMMRQDSITTTMAPMSQIVTTVEDRKTNVSRSRKTKSAANGTQSRHRSSGSSELDRPPAKGRKRSAGPPTRGFGDDQLPSTSSASATATATAGIGSKSSQKWIKALIADCLASRRSYEDLLYGQTDPLQTFPSSKRHLSSTSTSPPIDAPSTSSASDVRHHRGASSTPTSGDQRPRTILDMDASVTATTVTTSVRTNKSPPLPSYLEDRERQRQLSGEHQEQERRRKERGAKEKEKERVSTEKEKERINMEKEKERVSMEKNREVTEKDKDGLAEGS